MSKGQLPKLVQLDPQGHYVTPNVRAFLGVEVATKEVPATFHFLLADGSSLDLPVEAEAVEKIRVALEHQFPEYPDFPPLI